MDNSYEQIKDGWEQEYSTYNPAPVKMSTTINNNWWEHNSKMLISFIVTLAIVIGSRTGWSIYKINTDEGFPVIFAVALSISLVWSVEGYIAYYGISRVRHLEVGKFEKYIGMIAMIVGAILSAVAGLNYVIGIAKTLEVTFGAFVETSLSLLLSVGLTFVLYGIAEFAGRARWEHDNMPQIEELAYQRKFNAYMSVMGQAWIESPEYIEMRGERLRRAEELKFDISNASTGRSKLRRERQQLELEADRERMTEKFGGKQTANFYNNSPFGDGTARKEIVDYMEQYELENDGDIPRQADVCAATGRNKAYVHNIWHERYDNA